MYLYLYLYLVLLIMNKKDIYIIRKILMLSFPILLGYIPLGMTFGILANKIQIGLPLTAAMSFLCFTGAGQFMLLSLLAAGTNFVEIFIISYLVNLRHSFYIISLWNDISNLKVRYFCASILTDEIFAVLNKLAVENQKNSNSNKNSQKNSGNQKMREKLYFGIAFLAWSYWITFSVVGYLCGAFLNIDLSGLEFCLTSLFVAIAIEMFSHHKNFLVLSVAILIGVLSVIFIPKQFILVSAILLALLFLYVCQNKLEKSN